LSEDIDEDFWTETAGNDALQVECICMPVGRGKGSIG
jgi:hypothetical protein